MVTKKISFNHKLHIDIPDSITLEKKDYRDFLDYCDEERITQTKLINILIKRILKKKHNSINPNELLKEFKEYKDHNYYLKIKLKDKISNKRQGFSKEIIKEFREVINEKDF